MNIVIATGSPDSGWEIALPILRQSGLGLPDGSVAELLEECVDKYGMGSSIRSSQAMPSDMDLLERLNDVLSVSSVPPVLFADSRNLGLVDFWAKQFPQARFLLFYSRPEAALAYAVSHEFEPHQALEGWMAANRKLLDFHRHHRLNSMIFAAEEVVDSPDEFVAACQRFGFELKAGVFFRREVKESLSLEKCVAAGFIATQAKVNRMQMELEASSQPLGADEHSATKPEELLHGLADYHASQKHLQQQLRKTQQALGESESACRQARQKYEMLMQDYSQALAKNNAQLLFSEQIEKIERERQLLEVQLGEARGHIQNLETSELEALRQNEQLLQQVQQLETAQRDTALENELLIAQLHQVQEELEYYYFKWQGHVEAQQSRLVDNSDEHEKLSTSSGSQKLLSWSFPEVFFGKRSKACRGDRKRIQQEISLLKASGLFDEDWYLSVYPDVASAGMDPVRHYLMHGAAEGRYPSPLFDTQAYLQANLDVCETKINPLLHYVKFGKAEGRITRRPEIVSWS